MARLIDVAREEGGQSLIRGWEDHDWIGAPFRIGDRIAGLIGAVPGEVVVTDSAPVNLFKLLAATCALRPDRRTILTVAVGFPAENSLAEGLMSGLGGDYGIGSVPKADIASASTTG